MYIKIELQITKVLRPNQNTCVTPKEITKSILSTYRNLCCRKTTIIIFYESFTTNQTVKLVTKFCNNAYSFIAFPSMHHSLKPFKFA